MAVAAWKKRLVAGALKEINTIRALVGLPPIKKIPLGKIGASLSCPQAKALKVGVDVGTCSVSVDGNVKVTRKWPTHIVNLPNGGTMTVAAGGETLNMKTPKYMAKFIAEFDDGRIPEYDVKAQD